MMPFGQEFGQELDDVLAALSADEATNASDIAELGGRAGLDEAALAALAGVVQSNVDGLAALEGRVAALENAPDPEPDPDPDPEPDPDPDPVELPKGTWVLQQVGASISSGVTNQLQAAINKPESVGLSIRTGWSNIERSEGTYNFAVFEQGLAIANAANKPFSVRFMAGQHTPSYVGGPYYTEENVQVPVPWNADGSPRQDYLNAYAGMVQATLAWGEANGVTLFHFPWPGAVWAELNNGSGCRSTPGYGSNWTKAWLPTHKAWVDVVAAAVANKPNIYAEFPLTGRGPLTGGQSAALADYIFAALPARSIVQMNGWDYYRIGGATGSTETAWKALMSDVRDRGQLRALQDISNPQWAAPTKSGEAVQAYDQATLYDVSYCEAYEPRWRDGLYLSAAADWVS